MGGDVLPGQTTYQGGENPALSYGETEPNHNDKTNIGSVALAPSFEPVSEQQPEPKFESVSDPESESPEESSETADTQEGEATHDIDLSPRDADEFNGSSKAENQGTTIEIRDAAKNDSESDVEETMSNESSAEEEESEEHGGDKESAKTKEELMESAKEARVGVNRKEETPLEVGRECDIKEVGEKIGQSLADLLKDAPDETGRTITYLKFADELAKHYEEAGEDVSLNLQALCVVNEFVDGWAHKTEQEVAPDTTVRVVSQGDRAVEVTKEATEKTERWHIPMYDDDPEGRAAYIGDDDHARYEVIDTKAEKGNFDLVETISTRVLGEDDVESLKQLFDEAREYHEQKIDSQDS